MVGEWFFSTVAQASAAIIGFIIAYIATHQAKEDQEVFIGRIPLRHLFSRTRRMLILGVFVPYFVLLDYPIDLNSLFPIFGILPLDTAIFLLEIVIVLGMYYYTAQYITILANIDSEVMKDLAPDDAKK